MLNNGNESDWRNNSLDDCWGKIFCGLFFLAVACFYVNKKFSFKIANKGFGFPVYGMVQKQKLITLPNCARKTSKANMFFRITSCKKYNFKMAMRSCSNTFCSTIRFADFCSRL